MEAEVEEGDSDEDRGGCLGGVGGGGGGGGVVEDGGRGEGERGSGVERGEGRRRKVRRKGREGARRKDAAVTFFLAVATHLPQSRLRV